MDGSEESIHKRSLQATLDLLQVALIVCDEKSGHIQQVHTQKSDQRVPNTNRGPVSVGLLADGLGELSLGPNEVIHGLNAKGTRSGNQRLRDRGIPLGSSELQELLSDPGQLRRAVAPPDWSPGQGFSNEAQIWGGRKIQMLQDLTDTPGPLGPCIQFVGRKASGESPGMLGLPF